MYGEFRSAAGLALYVAEEYIPLKFAVNQVLREASKPTVGTWNRLKKVARMLVKHRRCVVWFVWQERTKELLIKVDANHAGCKRTGKSTSCVIIKRKNHCLMGLSATQPIIVLSSGQSEFAA